jgi:hypothetical protein
MVRVLLAVMLLLVSLNGPVKAHGLGHGGGGHGFGRGFHGALHRPRPLERA